MDQKNFINKKRIFDIKKDIKTFLFLLNLGIIICENKYSNFILKN